MKKKELIDILSRFNDDSNVVFVTEFSDLLELDDEGMDINYTVEVNNGKTTIIALMTG